MKLGSRNGNQFDRVIRKMPQALPFNPVTRSRRPHSGQPLGWGLCKPAEFGGMA